MSETASAQLHGSSYVPHDDRRKFVRKKLQRRAKLTLLTGQQYLGMTADVSEAGISVILDSRIPVNSLCKVEFDFFHQGNLLVVALPGKVVNCICVSEGFRAGLYLVINDPQIRQAIAELLQ